MAATVETTVAGNGNNNGGANGVGNKAGGTFDEIVTAAVMRSRGASGPRTVPVGGPWAPERPAARRYFYGYPCVLRRSAVFCGFYCRIGNDGADSYESMRIGRPTHLRSHD